MARERLRGSAAALDLLLAGCLLVFLVAVSPHLVIHAFEEHQDHSHHTKPTCLLYIQNQLTIGEMQFAPTGIGPPALAEALLDERPATHLPTAHRYAIRPRAPPRFHGLA